MQHAGTIDILDLVVSIHVLNKLLDHVKISVIGGELKRSEILICGEIDPLSDSFCLNLVILQV